MCVCVFACFDLVLSAYHPSKREQLPSTFKMKRFTGDTLQNLTSRNISDYLVKTYPQILKKRYRNTKPFVRF